MTRQLLWRGMLAGILGALLATLFARGFAEPQIDLAIGYEEDHAAHGALPDHPAPDHPAPDHAGMAMASAPLAHPHPADEEELVSRDTQKGAGLVTALALYGAAVGGIFSLVFAYGYGRMGHLGPRSFALLLAALTFVLVVVVPAIKYPQTPPAVGKHETVALRTAAYFGMIALSLGAAVVAGRLRGRLARPGRGFDATLLAFVVYLGMVGLGQFLLPAINEVPADFPAVLLWNFRLASMGTQLVLWATIGLAFGLWAERVLRRQSA
ncbi:CbtA family protein [Novosphingobium sp. ST904]|uniref:CbtA family protein n=1 Tax=Novosphingobium sp. ST904 TaxID=1684385 RepID=UPI0006C88E9A|nr:CbtA family protein [Novosphingobium sp. ST904]KPH58170.1 membrane protein [Novosphingobium sp. ST904]TCM41326.1 putative cobalt transporter CbtA [Novosphingobium sp. ST904]